MSAPLDAIEDLALAEGFDFEQAQAIKEIATEWAAGRRDPGHRTSAESGLEIRSLVASMTRGKSVKESGRLLHAFALELGVSTCTTQKELASRIKLSRGRISQIVKGLQREYSRIAKLCQG